MYYKGIIEMNDDSKKIARFTEAQVAHFVYSVKKCRELDEIRNVFKNFNVKKSEESYNSVSICHNDVSKARFLYPDLSVFVEI